MLLLVLRRAAPKVLSLSAIVAAVRTEAPALSARHAAAAAKTRAALLGPIGASAGSGGVWGCGCASHDDSGGVCAHGLVRSAPPPPGDLLLEADVSAALAEMEQAGLVQQPVVRTFRAASIANNSSSDSSSNGSNRTS
jgi:hypothetical protein